jgi:hypothetical protein
MLRLSISILLIGTLTACASIQLRSEAERIIVSRNPAPKGCKYVGHVIGSQGGSWSGGWTSNKNLAEGAFNDMKNKAAKLGANYVQLETNQAGVTGSAGMYSGTGGGSTQQTDVTNVGNAYRCNPDDIGL